MNRAPAGSSTLRPGGTAPDVITMPTLGHRSATIAASATPFMFGIVTSVSIAATSSRNSRMAMASTPSRASTAWTLVAPLPLHRDDEREQREADEIGRPVRLHEAEGGDDEEGAFPERGGAQEIAVQAGGEEHDAEARGEEAPDDG